MADRLHYHRVLLKLSGEALMGDQGFGIDPKIVSAIAGAITRSVALGAKMAVVVGGGNIFRGVQVAARGGDRVTGDHMGMMATVMNCLALKSALMQNGTDAQVLSALTMPEICDRFTQRGATAAFESGQVLLLGGGTGNPFFTTDTGAALRAVELGCDVLMKATQVDGIYSADPKTDPAAERYDRLTHEQVLKRDLKVMDATAIALARDNRIPIIVFSIADPNAVIDVLEGGGMATLVE